MSLSPHARQMAAIQKVIDENESYYNMVQYAIQAEQAKRELAQQQELIEQLEAKQKKKRKSKKAKEQIEYAVVEEPVRMVAVPQQTWLGSVMNWWRPQPQQMVYPQYQEERPRSRQSRSFSSSQNPFRYID